jgi:hypothetical protein
MKKTDAKRRNFMLTLGLGGIAAAAAVLTGKSSHAAEAVETATQPADKQGYRLTEHIKHYYRSTRI